MESRSRSGSESDEYENKSDCEDLEDYKVGGYHPVILGETFNNNKYQVIQKLGYGYFSTVWLINEKKSKNYYALKIQKSKDSYSESALDEIQLLEVLRKCQQDQEWQKTREFFKEEYKIDLKQQETFNVEYIENFKHYGMHGKHYCSVFEILGPSLLDLIQHYENYEKGIPINIVKILSRQLLIGLDYMHRICKIIHTDLKPENVMIHLEDIQLTEFLENLKNLKNLKKKPLSMKFIKILQTTNNNKNKKKKDKKRQKKLLAQQQQSQQITPDTTPSQDNNNDNNNSNNNIIDQQQQQQQDEEQIHQEADYEQEYKEYIQQSQEEDDDELQEQQQGQQQEQQLDEETLNTLVWRKHIRIQIDEKMKIKIVDFGNGCWIDKHFTENIQTREYRSPEVLLGINYEANTDIWSLACIIFEMLTGSFLFKPKKGQTYSKNEDHLALMIETLGPIPKTFALSGKLSKEYFNRNGNLVNLKELKQTSIQSILEDEFQFDPSIAKDIELFLLPMLQYDPKKRISALDALKSPWLWT